MPKNELFLKNNKNLQLLAGRNRSASGGCGFTPKPPIPKYYGCAPASNGDVTV